MHQGLKGRVPQMKSPQQSRTWDFVIRSGHTDGSVAGAQKLVVIIHFHNKPVG